MNNQMSKNKQINKMIINKLIMLVIVKNKYI